ncbi:MAG TPA: hypothetical protein VGR89_05340 [Puia sp.]|nr:hypothetical protein [Puia sp.]
MPTAGYSGTPLLKKLGLKDDLRIRLLHQPADYFQLLETDVSGQLAGPGQVPDFVHLFASSRAVFEKEMRVLAKVWKANPRVVIWVSWYKKSSGIATDLTEDLVRGYALKNGLVDIKVCAVSESWSGLKLVVPLDKR